MEFFIKLFNNRLTHSVAIDEKFLKRYKKGKAKLPFKFKGEGSYAEKMNELARQCNLYAGDYQKPFKVEGVRFVRNFQEIPVLTEDDDLKEALARHLCVLVIAGGDQCIRDAHHSVCCKLIASNAERMKLAFIATRSTDDSIFSGKNIANCMRRLDSDINNGIVRWKFEFELHSMYKKFRDVESALAAIADNEVICAAMPYNEITMMAFRDLGYRFKRATGMSHDEMVSTVTQYLVVSSDKQSPLIGSDIDFDLCAEVLKLEYVESKK